MSLRQHRSGNLVPLLLLPPLGADHRFFGPLIEELEDDHAVWSADAAPRSSESGVSDVADRIAADLDAAGLPPVVPVGVSLGGLVAQHLAAARPDLVVRLVLADTLRTYPEPMRQMWQDRADQVDSTGLAALLDVTLDTWFGPAEGRSAELEQRCADMVLDAAPSSYAASCRALRDADTTAVLPAVSAPTLVVCGEHDGPAFQEGARDLAARLSTEGEVAWIRGGHHAALLEQPGQAATLIAAHLAGAAK